MRSSSKAIIKGAMALQKATEREDRSRKNSEIQSTPKKLSAKKYNLVANSKSDFISFIVQRIYLNNILSISTYRIEKGP